METDKRKLRLIREILEIDSDNLLDDLSKSLAILLLEERINMEGEAKISIVENKLLKTDETPNLNRENETIQERDNYRNSLINAVNELSDMRIEVFNILLSIAMSGVYKEINDSFEVGAYYEFHVDQFRNSSDINLEKMVNLHDSMNDAIASLINLNSIKIRRD